MIDFMKENPGWVFLYLVILAGVVSSIAEIIGILLLKKNKDK